MKYKRYFSFISEADTVTRTDNVDVTFDNDVSLKAYRSEAFKPYSTTGSITLRVDVGSNPTMVTIV